MANKRIDTTAVIERVRLQEQGADPANPSAGYVYLYVKTDGLYIVQDDGTVIGPFSAGGWRFYTFTVSGELTVDPNPIRITNLTGDTLTISEVYLAVNTAPTGAAVIVDVHKDGVTIFTNQAHRPQIAATAFDGSTTTIDVDAWASMSYLQIDVDQIGSTLPGEDLTVTIIAS